MANQGQNRRQVLEWLGKAALASQYPGFCRWAYAGDHSHHNNEPDSAAKRPGTYSPQYFNSDEYRTLEILSELIIPEDDTPGARTAGVSEFIDFMAAHGYEEIQRPMRSGLTWLDRKSKAAQGNVFAELQPDQQVSILKSIAYKNPAVPAEIEGQVFFKLVRRYTVMGYYTSRAGLQELDFPGLRFYSESPSCPHRDDAEHKHLPPPRY